MLVALDLDTGPVPAWEASLSVLGTPVVAILSSRLTFGEAFKTTEIAGILLIGGGLALLSLLSWAASKKNPLPAKTTTETA